MRKNILFYFVAFALLTTVSWFFVKAYQELVYYTELTKHSNTVYDCFQNLSEEINKAAVSNPDLVAATNSAVRGLFFADSTSVIQQVNLLKSIVRDSVNSNIVDKLDTLIKSEVSWLVKSNVPDSIVHHQSAVHIAALYTIDSLIAQGIIRKSILIDFENKRLDETIHKIVRWMIAFVILSAALLIYTTLNFFTQKTKTLSAEKELDKTFREMSDYKYAIDESSIVAITDNRGIITYVNNNFCKISKYKRQELIGQDHRIINSGYHPKEFIHNLWVTIASGRIWKGELKNRAKDGTIYWVDTTIVPFLSKEKRPYQYVAIRADITERKRIEENLEKSLKETLDYKFALDESAIVAITDHRGIIKHVNENFCKISKYTAAELIGQDHRIVNSGYHSKEFIRGLWSTIASGKIWKGELRNKTKGGLPYWVDTTIVPFLNDDGKPYQYVAIRADITSRKRAEEENEKNEVRFRNMMDKLLEGVEIIGFDFRYLYVNEAYEKQVRHTKQELLGRTIMQKFPGIEQTSIFKALYRCLHARVVIHMEEEYTFPDGIKTWFEISFQPVPEGVFILSVDITQKKHAEEGIRQSEHRFRSLIENSYDIVSISDENFRPVYRSPASVRITGWTNEDRDKDSTGAVGQTHPDDLQRLRDIMKKVLDNPEVSFSISFRTRHKDGHYIFLEGLITNMLHHDAIKGIVSNFRDVTETRTAEEKIKESEKIYKTIASSIPGSVICLIDRDYRYFLVEGDMLESLGYSKEKLLGNKVEDVIPPERFAEVLPQFHRVFNGESFAIENARAGFDTVSRFVPLKDEANHVVAAMIVLFDVSELKKAQRSIAELNVGLEHKIKERTAELQVVNKELEAFSYSVAHDLRAPLRSINGYATMLLEDYYQKFDEEGKRMIDAVTNNAKKMGTLIDDLLAFSKLGKQEIRKSLVNMKQIADSSLEDIHLAEGYSGVIKINDLHAVNADLSLMKHVMINLLNNAVKYSSKKEKPAIEISSWKENEMIIHSVKDNGVGFDMAYADKLFGVFQRLHSQEEFEGTGVGLAIVQRIIHRHGGEIWAESKVNQGATFYFSLPILSSVS